MSDIFEIIPAKKESKDSPATFSLGIKMTIDQIDTVCSITEFLLHDELISKINSLQNELAEIVKRLESIDNVNANHGLFYAGNDASPQEIWEYLSSVTDNSRFIEIFNSLDEHKRRELADHVFTNCNMFTGKGAFFSAHYLQESALLAG